MTKVSYKERERQRREQEILEQAVQLIVERGYANLNMDELADIVGISKPTLYQHFKSKDDLISQAIIYYFSRMQQRLGEGLTGTPLNRLEQLMRRMIRGRFAKDNVLAALDQETLWPLIRTHPGINEHRAKAYEGLKVLVQEAIDHGEIDPDLPPQFVVRSMFCFQNAVSDPATKAELMASEEKLEAASDIVVRMFLRAIRPDSRASE